MPALPAHTLYRGQHPLICEAQGGAHRLLNRRQHPHTALKYELRRKSTEKQQSYWASKVGAAKAACVLLHSPHHLCLAASASELLTGCVLRHSGENVLQFVIMTPALLLILERHQIRLFSY